MASAPWVMDGLGSAIDQNGGDEQRKQQEQIKKVKRRCLMKEQSIVKAMQQVRGLILRTRDSTHMKTVASVERYVMQNPVEAIGLESAEAGEELLAKL
eukprot:270477-Amphidinium_carterae.1